MSEQRPPDPPPEKQKEAGAVSLWLEQDREAKAQPKQSADEKEQLPRDPSETPPRREGVVCNPDAGAPR
jgi:hypothetical protein